MVENPNKRTMILKQINGQELELDLSSDVVQYHYLNKANYMEVVVDEFNQEPFKDHISVQDKVILDIGANVGLFALVVMPYAERIICVEPTPEHQAVMRELLDSYGFAANGNELPVVNPIKETKISHEQSALHNYTGQCGFYRESVNSTMNKVNNNGEPGFAVDCITLFDLCKKYDLKHVDLCKIDIEGGEFTAVTVETVSPVYSIIDKFILEVHPRNLESQNHFKVIFEECGYKVELFDFNGSVFVYK